MISSEALAAAADTLADYRRAASTAGRLGVLVVADVRLKIVPEIRDNSGAVGGWTQDADGMFWVQGYEALVALREIVAILESRAEGAADVAAAEHRNNRHPMRQTAEKAV